MRGVLSITAYRVSFEAADLDVLSALMEAAELYLRTADGQVLWDQAMRARMQRMMQDYSDWMDEHADQTREEPIGYSHG